MPFTQIILQTPLTTRRMQVNYNFSVPMLEAILQLIEQRLAEPEDERDHATGEPISAGGYQNRLQDSDYYALFVETVPDDVKRLYTEAESGDLDWARWRKPRIV